MRLFEYRGRSRGASVSGQLEGASPEAVALDLASVGITPIDISEVRASEDALAFLRAHLRRSTVDLEDLIIFARQMYTMIRAGLPIIRSLNSIAETAHSELLVSALQDVVANLQSGRELASSLQRHPKVFSSLFVSTVRMGEDAGRLEEAFAQLSTYLEVDRDTRKRIKAATRYPLLVLGSIVVALVILNLFAFPVFAEVFADFGAELPWATKLLIKSSELSLRYWPHFCIAGIAGVAGIRAHLNTERGRLRWHRRKLRLPIVGKIIEKATLARFARTFSLALRSGIPLIEALSVAAQVVDNDYMAQRILFLRKNVERGESLSRAATASGLFTSLVLQMMAVGEESGALDELLEEVAAFYERDVDYELKRLGDAIEPILIAGVGVVVLVLALGVYLPMWDLARAARGG